MKNNIQTSHILRFYETHINSISRIILMVIFLTLFLVYGIPQSDTLNSRNNDKEVAEISESTIKNENDTLTGKTEKVGEPLDSTVLDLGNKLIIFIEYEDGMVIDRIDLRTGEKKRVLDMGSGAFEPAKDTAKFRGHWSGIEVGLNNYVNSDNSFDLPEGYDYMELNTFRSWNLNFNFAQSTTPIIKDRLALVGGFGVEINSYVFSGDNNIQVNETSNVIEERILDTGHELKKSKFRTTHLTCPLLLEAQFGKSKDSKERFYISGGVIGGLRIGSTIKVKHEVNGKNHKLTERRDDLNINRWRLGLTARMGYKDVFDFYANYSLTPLFEDDMGPELYPVTVGIRMGF